MNPSIKTCTISLDECIISTAGKILNFPLNDIRWKISLLVSSNHMLTGDFDKTKICFYFLLFNTEATIKNVGELGSVEWGVLTHFIKPIKKICHLFSILALLMAKWVVFLYPGYKLGWSKRKLMKQIFWMFCFYPSTQKRDSMATGSTGSFWCQHWSRPMI